MFGESVQMEEWMTVLPWVWTYLYKEDPITSIQSATEEDHAMEVHNMEIQ